ncbi:hypothetical protein E2562_016076 [Oryza meyeriana var. granulata]|uniref:AAA+ ATPase domain-containing protein n=1 Tax=Oryza meyeriana var. granulata TaxID=110450 RepID=A0A6G1BKX6_9ORYZ|nr:hypothetical protein E2562_016076 [Oryza meyeriana var. granulata]
MASVLGALASNVNNMLSEMAKEEMAMLLGVSGEIDTLAVKLGGLKDFLADAERRRITDQHVQGWVRELRDAMYDATDILELCQFKAMEDRKRFGNNQLLFCLRNPLRAHDIGRRIKALNQRLEGIKQRAGQFSFISLNAYADRGRTAQGHGSTRRTSPELDRSGVVGNKIKQDTRKLVEMLTGEEEEEEKEEVVEGSSNIRVVAIVGVGGIGKTTLAQNIFNHTDIKDKFDKTIWLSINQEFSDYELLRTAIAGAGGEHRGHQELSLLQPILREALTGKKIFLVMDDMWSVNAWSEVLRTPLVNSAAQGSWVLITTRSERVARQMKAIQPHHRVDKLSQEDAWSLLKKQVVSTEKDEYAIEKLKSTGLGIIERCDGLPVAIKAIAGLLSHKEINEIEWGKVLTSPSWSVDGLPEEINHAIYLSYDDLAPHLKQCLLYCSLFPKYSIPDKDLIVEMWISEGFVNGMSNQQEKLGIEYYNELILRNLIQTRPPNAWIMHDVVRSFCQHVAKDEALSSHMGKLCLGDLESNKYRWLSVQDMLDWSACQQQKSVRTLLLYGITPIKLNVSDLCNKFSSLRVLYIIGVQHATSVDSLSQLKNLRYLYLFRSNICSLPDGINKMKFLEYIGIPRCEQIVQLPGSIIKLERLRVVNLAGTNINSIPRGFSRLSNLRTVLSFPAQMGSSSSKEEWCSLEELGPLSQLRQLHLKRLENVSSGSSAAKAMLSAKEHLIALHLECNDRQRDDGLLKEEGLISMEEQQRIEEVFDVLCPPHCLEDLIIRGYIGWRLPKWMTSRTTVRLDRLMVLTMDGMPCCTELPDGLCQLPCLKFIKIKRAPAIKRVGHEFLQAQQNGDSHPSRDAVSFPILYRVEFAGMLEWEEWVWEDEMQAMPLLEVLILERCKLQQLPPGIASHARALRFLNLFKVQNIKSLQNLSSVVELHLSQNPDMESIKNLPKLRILTIVYCPKLTVLDGIPALQNLSLMDYNMKTLPGYLQDVKPRSLVLDCSLTLLGDISMGDSCSDWDKISHIQQISGYAGEMRIRRRWYVFYTREPFKLDTNIVCSSLSRGIIHGLLMNKEIRTKELHDLLTDKERRTNELRMIKFLSALLTVVGFVCIMLYCYGLLP